MDGVALALTLFPFIGRPYLNDEYRSWCRRVFDLVEAKNSKKCLGEVGVL